MGDVVYLPTGEIEAAALVESIKHMEFKELVVIGVDQDGFLFISAMTDQLETINAMIDVGKSFVVEKMRDNIPEITD